jgi:hypothetical protein
MWPFRAPLGALQGSYRATPSILLTASPRASYPVNPVSSSLIMHHYRFGSNSMKTVSVPHLTDFV